MSYHYGASAAMTDYFIYENRLASFDGQPLANKDGIPDSRGKLVKWPHKALPADEVSKMASERRKQDGNAREQESTDGTKNLARKSRILLRPHGH